MEMWKMKFTVEMEIDFDRDMVSDEIFSNEIMGNSSESMKDIKKDLEDEFCDKATVTRLQLVKS